MSEIKFTKNKMPTVNNGSISKISDNFISCITRAFLCSGNLLLPINNVTVWPTNGKTFFWFNFEMCWDMVDLGRKFTTLQTSF